MMHSMHFIYVYMEGNVLVNDALNTFYLWLYGVSHMVKDHSDSEREREMFYLTTHSTHFIYSYMASDIWLRTILIVRKETCCRHIGYSFRLTARVLLYYLYMMSHIRVKDQIMRKETCHHYFMDYSKRPIKFLPFQLV